MSESTTTLSLHQKSAKLSAEIEALSERQKRHEREERADGREIARLARERAILERELRSTDLLLSSDDDLKKSLSKYRAVQQAHQKTATNARKLASVIASLNLEIESLDADKSKLLDEIGVQALERRINGDSSESLNPSGSDDMVSLETKIASLRATLGAATTRAASASAALQSLAADQQAAKKQYDVDRATFEHLKWLEQVEIIRPVYIRYLAMQTLAGHFLSPSIDLQISRAMVGEEANRIVAEENGEAPT